MDFDFINRTRIIFGKQKESKIADVLTEYGFKKALLVYGKGSIKRSGLHQLITSKLQEAGIEYVELGGIGANPDVNYVRQGVALAKDNHTDCILAVGGGSVIDVSKSIGVSFFYEGDPLDFNLHKVKPSKTIPVGVVLTIASAGSESSDSCVISDYSKQFKKGFNSDVIRPLFAIEDPELTYTVSPYQTACGIADMMMHTMERFFGEGPANHLIDEWALALCRNVLDNGRIVIKDPTNYDARAALMLDSSLAHDGLTGIGKNYAFIVHPLEHALSAYKPEIAHGAGIAVMYLGWAEHVYKKDTKKFAELARRLFDIYDADETKTAIMGIRAMRDFYVSIGLPTSLKEIGLNSEDIPHLVSLATGNGTRVIGRYPQPLDESDVAEIYRLCL